jgi:hypothetical protein
VLLLSITGVLESGENRGRRVPANARTPIRVTQTSTVTVRMSALDSGGSPLPLAGNDLVLSVSKNPSQLPILKFPGVLQPTLGINVVDFPILPDDTSPDKVQAGQYVYDVWMTSPAKDRSMLVPISPFGLEPTVNRP